MNIRKIHKTKKQEIKLRIKQFRNLPKREYKKEFLFCLLTPQSKAQKCWEAVQELSKLKNPTLNQITRILKTKTRFHNTKAKRVLNNNWNKIKSHLNNANTPQLRNFLVKNVNGYGLKEASHFLRNIGKSNNQIAILDRHILRNLKVKKIKSPNHYLQIEQSFLKYAKKINIPIDELDLLWWSQENGEIFK